MKKKRNILGGIFTLVVLGFIIWLYVFINGKNIDSANKYLEDNGKYAIGRITEYSPENYDGHVLHSAYVKFGFIANAKYYEGTSYYVPKDNVPEIGSLYIAIYLPNNPDNSNLLFEYPLKDNVDYQRCIELFKKDRPKIK